MGAIAGKLKAFGQKAKAFGDKAAANSFSNKMKGKSFSDKMAANTAAKEQATVAGAKEDQMNDKKKGVETAIGGTDPYVGSSPMKRMAGVGTPDTKMGGGHSTSPMMNIDRRGTSDNMRKAWMAKKGY